MKFILNKAPISYEIDAIFYYLGRYNFFKAYNYNVTYPEQEEFKELIEKAKNGNIVDKDIEEVGSKFKKILNIEDYNDMYEHCEEVIMKNNKILEENKKLFMELKLSFDFKIFDKYLVNVTKYGPGGSYNSEDGSISTKYKKSGINYSTPIHELFHIGIEDSIIKKYEINHVTKEYIIDTFIITYFKKNFTDYKYQNLDDSSIDPYVKENIKVGFDFTQLDQIIFDMKTNVINQIK